MSTTVADIYKLLFAGETITLECPPDKYNSLRVALQRHHRLPIALDLTNDALIASYNRDKCIATFRLGPKKPKLEFTIISTEPSK